MRAVDAHFLQIQTALQVFRFDIGRYPTGEEGLKILWDTKMCSVLPNCNPEGYLAPAITDPWGAPYYYCVFSDGQKEKYQLSNYGKDGSFGGEDENEDTFFTKTLTGGNPSLKNITGSH